jgi:N-acetylglucosaminyldiphosphoundecaprenol N-acetyl-beta-D-mannosaminyltransferase
MSQENTSSGATSRRLRLLGGAVDRVTRDEVMGFVAEAVVAGRKCIIGNQNLHSLFLGRGDGAMSAFFDSAELIQIDSTPMLAWGRVLGRKLSHEHRSTYLDWRDRFWRQASEKGWRVFCLGATDDVNRAAIANLAREWPGACIAGQHGYFDRARDSDQNRAVVRLINAFRPDILFVGMGMPLQERWIVENFPALVSGVCLSIGAAFDYEAGAQVPAPRRLGALGLEWLFRLAHDPRRLSRRYLIEPWALIGPALEDVVLAMREAGARSRSSRIPEPVPGEAT